MEPEAVVWKTSKNLTRSVGDGEQLGQAELRSGPEVFGGEI